MGRREIRYNSRGCLSYIELHPIATDENQANDCSCPLHSPPADRWSRLPICYKEKMNRWNDTVHFLRHLALHCTALHRQSVCSPSPHADR
eukprot:jgi/Psemu1/307719/fgenesh1_kg.349_\